MVGKLAAEWQTTSEKPELGTALGRPLGRNGDRRIHVGNVSRRRDIIKVELVPLGLVRIVLSLRELGNPARKLGKLTVPDRRTALVHQQPGG